MRQVLGAAVAAAFFVAESSAGTVRADPFDDALDARIHQAYAAARTAADRGDAEAQHYLGVAYSHGLGVPQDYIEAVRWYRMAAKQGFAMAQFDISVMYLDGKGAPQDYVMAHMWSNLAAAALAPGPTRNMAVKNRDLAASHMTPAQLAEAQKLAREWLPSFPQ